MRRPDLINQVGLLYSASPSTAEALPAAWMSVHRVAGSAAYRLGWPRSYNPHPAGTQPRRQWRFGWLAAQRAENPAHALADPAGLAVERRCF